MNVREMVQMEIASEVSTTIAENLREGIEPSDTVEIYFAALGASIAILYDNCTMNEIYDMAGLHSKMGFLEATRSQLLSPKP